MGRGATHLTLLVAALLVTFLAGCGGSAPPPAARRRRRRLRRRRRRRLRLEDRLVVDAGPGNKLVSCGTRNGAGSEPTELSGLFSSNSVWNRPDAGTAQLGNQRLAQALIQEADSEIRAGTDRGSRRPSRARRCTSWGRASAACPCISTSRRPTARVSRVRSNACRYRPMPGRQRDRTRI